MIVEATRAIRQGGRGGPDDARADLDPLDVKPDSLTADSAYGSVESLAWLVKQKGITPLVPDTDKSNRPTVRSPAPTSPSIPNAGSWGCVGASELDQFHACSPSLQSAGLK